MQLHLTFEPLTGVIHDDDGGGGGGGGGGGVVPRFTFDAGS